MKARIFAVFVSVLTLAALLAVPALAGTTQVVMDDFTDGDVVGWNITPDGHNGRIEAVNLDGEMVGRVTFGSSCYSSSLRLDEPVTPDYIQWRMRADGDSGHPVGGPGLLVRGTTDDYHALAQVHYHRGSLQYFSGSYVNFMPAFEGTWYTIGLQNIDWTAHTFDLYIDGSLKVLSLPFIEPMSSFQYVQAYGCPYVNGPLYLDDIAYGFIIPDTDGDGVLDVDDNCPLVANADQGDFDADGIGDVCDLDVDGDTVLNADDMCPSTTLGDPPAMLKKNRFAADAAGLFVDVNVTESGFSVADTFGCDEDQIIEIMELGGGHVKFGIPRGVLLEFTSRF